MDRPSGTPYQIAEAAAILGLSVVACRKRCQRRTLTKLPKVLDVTGGGDSGDWLIYIDDNDHRPSGVASGAGADAVLVADLRDRVADLQATLQDARDERDRLLTLLEREQGLAGMHARRVLELEDSQSTTALSWWRRLRGP